MVTADIGSGRLAIEFYAASGSTALGAIASVARMQTTEEVNGLGTWSAEVPTRLVNRSIVTHGCEVSLIREGEGEVFRGLLDHISRSEHDASMTVLSGKSLAFELTWDSTYRAIQVVDETMANAMDALLEGTGWSETATGTFDDVTKRWDNVSRWAALIELATMRGAFVRETATARQVEIKNTFSASGIRLTNVAQAGPSLIDNPNVGVITGIESITEDSQELYNRIVAEAKVDGDDVFDLGFSNRSSPYTIQSFAGVMPSVVDLVANFGQARRIIEGAPLVLTDNSTGRGVWAMGDKRLSIAIAHSVTGSIILEAHRDDNTLPATIFDVIPGSSHQARIWADTRVPKGELTWVIGHNQAETNIGIHAVALTFRDHFRNSTAEGGTAFVIIATNTSGTGTSISSSVTPGAQFGDNTLFVDVVCFETGNTTCSPTSGQTVIYDENVNTGPATSRITIGIKPAVVGVSNEFNWTLGSSRSWIHMVFRIVPSRIFYIEDATSVAAYGTRTRILPLGGYGKINVENLTEAANTMYDRAVDYLIDHKDPLHELAGVKVGHLGRGGWNVGDTMEVEYRSEHGDIDETMVCVRRVADYDENGVRTWTLTLSNVKRFTRDLARLMADLVERVETAQHYQV